MSALNVTIDPSIKGAWPEARLGCFIYTADVRAREVANNIKNQESVRAP